MPEVLRLLERLLGRQRHGGGVYCVVRFPDSVESGWYEKLPTPGMRVRTQNRYPYRARTWIVDEVLRSGRDTYTVFCVGRKEYVNNLRSGSDRKPDLQTELLELARRTNEAVAEQRRRWKWKSRHYLP